jgi:hypothetical protein
MKQLTYKTQWRAFERLSHFAQAGILETWWFTLNGEVVIVVRRERKRKKL